MRKERHSNKQFQIFKYTFIGVYLYSYIPNIVTLRFGDFSNLLKMFINESVVENQ